MNDNMEPGYPPAEGNFPQYGKPTFGAWWHRNVDHVWLWTAFIALALFMGLLWFLPVAKASEITIGPLWQNVSAGPFGQDVRGRNTIVEGKVLIYAPIVWGGIQFQTPHKFSADVILTEKTTILGTEFAKTETSDEPLKIDGQSSLQRVMVGTYLRPWARPYLCAEGYSCEWNFVQAGKSKRLTVSDIQTRAFVGGGLRIDAVFAPYGLVYADVSLLNGHQGYEAGIEGRYDRWFVGGFYRYDRFSLPATGNSFGLQAGVRF